MSTFSKPLAARPSALVDALPPLVFVLGKGGVGRTTVSTALALACARRGEKVLVVQKALRDSVSPLLGLHTLAGPSETEILPNFFTYNYNVDEAIREYFVQHLKMKMLHKMVVENRHVQKLIHAAPGIEELFFLGRIFWLLHLAKGERGWAFDRIVVDAPATGHGMGLFTLAPAIAGFGITGPLAHECARVTSMLQNPDTTGTFLVTLPEELPVEETLEFMPKVSEALGYAPRAVVVNRSAKGIWEPKGGAAWWPAFCDAQPRDVRDGLEAVWQDLERKVRCEEALRGQVKGPIYALPELFLMKKKESNLDTARGRSARNSALLEALVDAVLGKGVAG